MYTKHHVFAVALASTLLAGCKIPLSVSEGGNVTSASGDHDCPENQTCVVEPEDGEPFAETWTATANPGYVFAGWDSLICKNQVGSCAVNVPGQLTALDEDFPLSAPFVAPKPMHYLYSFWGLGATPGVSSLLYGFRQADVGDLSESGDTFALGNECNVLTALIDTVDQSPPGVNFSGNCFPQSSVQLPSDGPFAFIYPEVQNGPTTLTETVLPVDLTELSENSNRVSVSMANSSSSNSDNGFTTRSFLNTFVAEKSDNMTIAQLAGDWLLTRLEIIAVPTVEKLFTVAGYRVSISTADGGTIVSEQGGESYETEYIQENGLPLEERYFGTYTQDSFSFPLTVAHDGAMSFNPFSDGETQTIAGFVTPSADFFVLAEGNPSIDAFRNGNTEINLAGDEASHQLMVGIRPNPAPDLIGKRYRLVGVVFEVKSDRLGLYRFTDKAQVGFDTGSDARWRFRNEGYRVDVANAQGIGLESYADSGQLKFDYTVFGNGRIELFVDSLDGVDKSMITGYATRDNRMLVFAHGLLQDEGEEGQVGMWIGYCTNCD